MPLSYGELRSLGRVGDGGKIRQKQVVGESERVAGDPDGFESSPLLKESRIGMPAYLVRQAEIKAKCSAVQTFKEARAT
jgi:hypothetical protein